MSGAAVEGTLVGTLAEEMLVKVADVVVIHEAAEAETHKEVQRTGNKTLIAQGAEVSKQ